MTVSDLKGGHPPFVVDCRFNEDGMYRLSFPCKVDLKQAKSALRPLELDSDWAVYPCLDHERRTERNPYSSHTRGKSRDMKRYFMDMYLAHAKELREREFTETYVASEASSRPPGVREWWRPIKWVRRRGLGKKTDPSQNEHKRMRKSVHDHYRNIDTSKEYVIVTGTK